MQQGIEAIQRGQLDLQGRELELRRQSQEMDFELRRRAQDAELELRRYALDRAHDNEQAASNRLASIDQAKIDYARRGQTFAMWLAAISSGTLLLAGLVCIFLAIAGAISVTAGLTAGGILIAGGVFTGLAKIIGKFMPRDSKD